jgi:hypothetical protein
MMPGHKTGENLENHNDLGGSDVGEASTIRRMKGTGLGIATRINLDRHCFTL